MKRSILAVFTICILTMAGAAVAQSTLNTTAPGPTTQQAPGLTNNNLPNPGNPVPQPTTQADQVPTTSTEPMTEEPSTVTDDIRTGATATGTAVQETTGTADVEPTDTTTASADTEDTLPNTASDMPLVALIGLASLGAAFLVRFKA